MNSIYLKMLAKMQALKNGEEGQDLVEYALIVSLIALAAVGAVGNVAGAINGIFNGVSSSIT